MASTTLTTDLPRETIDRANRLGINPYIGEQPKEFIARVDVQWGYYKRRNMIEDESEVRRNL